jgi:hypothetical protein
VAENQWKARARVSINFRKFSPCIARVAGTRGFDSLPSLWDVGTVSLPMNYSAVLMLLLSGNKASLALFPERKQKYQIGSIHRKLKVATSVIFSRP